MQREFSRTEESLPRSAPLERYPAPGAAENQVIEHPDAQQLAGVRDAAGEGEVLDARIDARFLGLVAHALAQVKDVVWPGEVIVITPAQEQLVVEP